jgi:Protein of unknown function (DUF3306)
MSEGESFLARWSRLKREQAAAPSRSDAQAPEHAPPPVDTPPPGVDLASLPPIESIGPGSDISAYLGAGVPLELTQAALRSAWRTDPAIREFIEIADNQWDFNAPGAIPGFGSLGAAEEAKALVARAAATAESTAATLASLKPGSDRPDSQVTTGMSLEDSRVVDPVWQAGAVPLAKVEPASVETPEKHLEPDAPAPSRRLHGGALPK